MATDLFSADVQLAGPAPKGLGRAMAGDAAVTPREAMDFYPTPPAAIRALLHERHEGRYLPAMTEGGALPIWEPCGRGDAIASACRAAGYRTVATDIIADPAHGVEAGNLFDFGAKTRLSPVIITNPPFALAAEMIVHIMARIKPAYCALLLKATFWHAAERTGLFAAHPPARIWALNWRLDFMNKGAPVMDCIWCIWAPAAPGAGTRYQIMTRAEMADQQVANL